jgi:hypothetical protein
MQQLNQSGFVVSRLFNSQIPANFSCKKAVDFGMARGRQNDGLELGFPTMNGLLLRGRVYSHVRPNSG